MNPLTFDTKGKNKEELLRLEESIKNLIMMSNIDKLKETNKEI